MYYLELELIPESADLIIFKSKAQRGHRKQDPHILERRGQD